jgi:hypothetical protein
MIGDRAQVRIYVCMEYRLCTHHDMRWTTGEGLIMYDSVIYMSVCLYVCMYVCNVCMYVCQEKI